MWYGYPVLGDGGNIPQIKCSKDERLKSFQTSAFDPSKHTFWCLSPRFLCQFICIALPSVLFRLILASPMPVSEVDPSIPSGPSRLSSPGSAPSSCDGRREISSAFSRHFFLSRRPTRWNHAGSRKKSSISKRCCLTRPLSCDWARPEHRLAI